MKVRNGSSKEIPLIQGKEQQLCFAGTAVKRYPKPKARAAAGRNYPHRRPGLAAGRSNPGAVAAQAQKGLEELAHVEGQEWQR